MYHHFLLTVFKCFMEDFTTNRIYYCRTTKCNRINFMECAMAYFISHIYRIDWWTRIILLALIKNKSSISIDVVICITINCNNCGIYHFRRTFKSYNGNGGLSYIDWCIFGQSFNTTDLFQKRAVIREGDVI